MELIILFFFIFYLLFFTARSRGDLGESHAKFKMWIALNSKIYKRFHDIIIPSKNGTTQIDHIIISPFGIFIVETKNIKGWIFGSENKAKWTQSLYGNNYSFQNPLRQTFRQKRILSQHLNIEENVIYPIIYFVGNCTFKTALPNNVINHGLGRYIKKYQEIILSEHEIERIMKQLRALQADPFLTTKNHIQSLKDRHNSETICPKCGSDLIKRTARKGANSGSNFIGCSNYPRCKFTKNI